MDHKDNNCKTIGLLVEDTCTDYTKDITHSVAHSIMARKDLKLVMIAGKQDYSTDPGVNLHHYRQIYNSIYLINSLCHFDGLLVSFPNLNSTGMDYFGDIPRVLISSEKKGELSVSYNNEKGIREALDYLVRIKGFTRICMLGGRDDNTDARKRKEIVTRFMAEAGLPFSDDQYVWSDMSDNTQESAAKLLKNNPDAQAIFCVNDAAASGLYDVMRENGLVPGKDIYVFGFDNAVMAVQMVPPLASIGADGVTVGQKALEILLDKIDGKEPSSAYVPTRFFGRDSFEYETYEITSKDILMVDSAFIYSFFDDCFYRYGNEIVDKGDVDLRRLFYEIISRMMSSIKNRYMDEKQYSEIRRLIDAFFDNGAMRYTDANKLVKSLSRLQGSMNETLRGSFSNSYNNRLFSYIRNKAIQSQAFEKAMEDKLSSARREMIQSFLINTAKYYGSEKDGIDNVIDNIDKLGFGNSALYLFREPVIYKADGHDTIPETIDLRCVYKNGALYVIPEDRRKCSVSEIYSRSELSSDIMGQVSFPVFYGNYLFGILVCGISRMIMDSGEYLTELLARAIYMNIEGGFLWPENL